MSCAFISIFSLYGFITSPLAAVKVFVAPLVTVFGTGVSLISSHVLFVLVHVPLITNSLFIIPFFNDCQPNV